MNYLMSSWDDRRKATAKDVFKVGLKLTEDFGNGDPMVAATASIGKNQGKGKGTTEKCPRHPYMYHKWAKCDLNPAMTYPIGRDKWKAEKMARTAGTGGNKQGQGYKAYKDDEFKALKALKAQVAAMAEASKVDTEPIVDSSVAMFAALRSTLETKAAKEVNVPASGTLYTIAPRNIEYSGASMSFVRNKDAVSNPSKHFRPLITAEGHTTYSTHAGKKQLTNGSQPVFVSALVVPSFKNNLISVGQLTKGNNVMFTSEGA